jgi:hypothetical protein
MKMRQRLFWHCDAQQAFFASKLNAKEAGQQARPTKLAKNGHKNSETCCTPFSAWRSMR